MLLLVNCGSIKVPQIEQILQKNKVKFKTKRMEDMALSQKTYKGIIISGAPILLVDEPMHINKFLFLKKIDIPVLGIFFGH